MKALLQFARRGLLAGLMASLFALLPASAAAQAMVMDSVIAVVNKHAVTWSDLDEQMRFEALQNHRQLASITAADRHAAFEHLMDSHLLREQMQAFTPVRDEELAQRLTEVRAAWQLDKDDVGWNALLARYGLSPARLRELVAMQLQVLQFVEFRVRPMVRVSRDEVDEYYTQRLLPKLIAQVEKPEALETVTGKIRALLAEKKLNEEMEKWLANLRVQSTVQVLWDAVKDSGATQH